MCKKELSGRGIFAQWLAAAMPLLLSPVVSRAEGGITNEGPFTVFRTGTNETLLTLSLPFSAPPTNSPSLLRFEIGFATAEPDVPDTFFDSFSVSLQNADLSATALLLTADRTGVQWAPANPGGLTLDPANVEYADASFADLNPALALKFAYSVTFALPALLTGSPLTLLFDLFDNLNTAASLAYVQGVRIESAVPVAKLHSATLVGGPYADETGALLNETNRIFTLNKPAGHRFFRVAADRQTKIVAISTAGNQVVVEYQFVQLALRSSPVVMGPYTVESTAALDETNRTFTVSPPTENRFYRVFSDVPTRLKSPRTSGGQLVLEYGFNP